MASMYIYHSESSKDVYCVKHEIVVHNRAVDFPKWRNVISALELNSKLSIVDHALDECSVAFSTRFTTFHIVYDMSCLRSCALYL